MKLTIEDIRRSPCGKLNNHLVGANEMIKKKSKIKKPRNDCKEVQKMHWDLKYFCIDNKIEFEKEYKFSKRKFRFDFALPEFKIAIEYDGINSKKSGHTTLVGFTKDTEKINLAISLGWRVLRYTVINYQNVLQDLQKII